MSECENIIRTLLPHIDTAVAGIFRLSGNNIRQLQLIECLRTGQDFTKLQLNSHDIATVVKQYLKEYPNRLFDSHTESVLSLLVKDNSEATFYRMQAVLKELSPDRISLLALVLPYFHKVAQAADVNKMDAANLARVIALDFFPDIFNPSGTDSTIVRQIVDWRIKVVEKLILYGDRLIDEIPLVPPTLTHVQSIGSVTPVYGKSESTSSCLTGDASQKRKRPPQSPLKSVWHGLTNGLTNIFNKTPRPGRPESTPPSGTPSFFSKFSNRLCPSGKKVKHEEDESADMMSGYRSDDNSLRIPPVKQNLRTKFSHKKKSPKPMTPARGKQPTTPLGHGANYGTFTNNPYPVEQAPIHVRPELFHFSEHDAPASSTLSRPDQCQQFGAPFVFSSQQNLSQQPVATMMQPSLSPVNISPDIPDDENANPLVNTNLTGESESNSNSNSNACDAMDAMETGTFETEVSVQRDTSSSSLPLVTIPEPSPSMSQSEEMRDQLSDLLNIGVTPRCRIPVSEKHHQEQFNEFEPVVETTFDDKMEAEKRLIAQVRGRLGVQLPCPNSASGSRRPSVANLERMGQVSQGRRLWEQGGPCLSSMSSHPSVFSLGVRGGEAPVDPTLPMQSNSFPRLHVPSVKRQTDL